MDDVIRALTDDPAQTALVMDFDGTLAEIVAHPDDAVPRPEVVSLLTRLCARFATVGVVSGRPVAFLRDRLPVARLALVGQYGLERWEAGRVVVDPAAEPFLGAVAEVGARAEAELTDVFVERKGQLAVTLHWRAASAANAAADRAQAWAEATAAETGLALFPTRMAVELRPPVRVDKGDGLTRLVADRTAALFAGDDHGDLAAFDALAALRAEGQLRTIVRVAVRSPEEPAELLARADVSVPGPEGFVSLLAALDGHG